MKHSDIIIIGGGAAGMMAAYGAASELRRSSAGKDTQVPEVTVLEKMPRPGRKIMITGKMQYNNYPWMAGLLFPHPSEAQSAEDGFLQFLHRRYSEILQ